jgi:hypothetical protein
MNKDLSRLMRTMLKMVLISYGVLLQKEANVVHAGVSILHALFLG